MPALSDASENQKSGGDGEGVRREGYILLIDDEDAILDVLTAVLQDDEGYEVFAVRSGKEALEKAPAARPSFIMLDLTLQNERAAEVVQMLRGRPSWEQVALVICSAIPHLREVAEQLGADGWLPKPFELEDLIAVARRFAGPAPRGGRA